MMITRDIIVREAAQTGFPPIALEKTLRLVNLLSALLRHPYLQGRIALKGGTALNLFVFDVPRLSVDIDLNYVGTADRERMLAERPKVEQAIEAVCSREGLNIRRTPSEHAGGKWRLGYVNDVGASGNLELDLNFLLRTPLWPVTTCDSRQVGMFQARGVPIIDLHELAGGKLAALLSRQASRDVFDARELLRRADLDPQKLRLAFTIYGAASRKDWRSISPDAVDVDPAELASQLVPVLRMKHFADAKAIAAWSAELVAECRALLSRVLPLTAEEREFISRLNDRGDIAPELLTTDETMLSKIREFPALQWKAVNVKKHFGSGGSGQIR